MTQSFYELLGVSHDAELDTIKAAYSRAVALMMRRREATVAQGGNTEALDLSRTQMDEAWQVLSDSVRRRKYDAMLALADTEGGIQASAAHWDMVAGALVHPAVLSATRLVDALTRLELGPLPQAARPVVPRHGSAAELSSATRTDDFGAPRPTWGGSSVPHTGVPTTGVPHTNPGQVIPFSPHGDPARAPTSPGQPMGGGQWSHDLPTEPDTRHTGAHHAPAPSMGELVNQHGYSGSLLQACREHRGFSLQELSNTTRISLRFLEAVEREDFAALPSAPAFVRGYVRELARQLDLDVDRVVEGYMRRFASQG